MAGRGVRELGEDRDALDRLEVEAAATDVIASSDSAASPVTVVSRRRSPALGGSVRSCAAREGRV
ncbi:hypothetical protein [Streptomyces coeruleorubidus]|uniref:Uncharacterized protein n=1 Tax=Streptomyces coeruleorubidus TaxID=116188 RepID=A0A5J6IFJ6_STRC4|nr:hypothetical protein [Streptomyces coeruleorubidus]QEV29660.1 hypothetical protein CP976_39875 [Streptomyces coeruleorubidus]GGT98886.1 hypothetical protein GCM10010256_68570 [Streptomyces coeruleorubidus]